MNIAAIITNHVSPMFRNARVSLYVTATNVARSLGISIQNIIKIDIFWNCVRVTFRKNGRKFSRFISKKLILVKGFINFRKNSGKKVAESINHSDVEYKFNCGVISVVASIQGSQGQLYHTEISQEKPSGGCTCQDKQKMVDAGLARIPCKHQYGLLNVAGFADMQEFLW